MDESERAILQRRIRNQRQEIRRLNRCIITYGQSRKFWMDKAGKVRVSCYRQAAMTAESFLFGRRIADAIRRWI